MIDAILYVIILLGLIIIMTAYTITNFYNNVISIAARNKLMHQCEILLAKVLITLLIILAIFAIVFILI